MCELCDDVFCLSSFIQELTESDRLSVILFNLYRCYGAIDDEQSAVAGIVPKNAEVLFR